MLYITEVSISRSAGQRKVCQKMEPTIFLPYPFLFCGQTGDRNHTRHQSPCFTFNSSDPKHFISYSAPERSTYDTTIPDIPKMLRQRIETYYSAGCCKFDCASRRLWHDKPPQHPGKSNTNSDTNSNSRHSTTDFDNHFSNSRGDRNRRDNSHHHRDCERHRRGIGGQGRCVGGRRRYLQHGNGDNHMDL